MRVLLGSTREKNTGLLLCAWYHDTYHDTSYLWYV